MMFCCKARIYICINYIVQITIRVIRHFVLNSITDIGICYVFIIKLLIIIIAINYIN